jgi:hypothetical protein
VHYSTQEPRHGALVRRFTPTGFSIGSLGWDKSDLLNGEGPINSLFSRDRSRLFAMRPSRHDCAADKSGPFPHMLPDALDDCVFGSSIFHIRRTCGGSISFRAKLAQWSGRRRFTAAGLSCNERGPCLTSIAPKLGLRRAYPFPRQGLR